MAKRAEIGVAVVSWNGKEHLKRLMPSLTAQRRQPLDIVVADNGSIDGTAAWLAKHHPEVHLISLPENFGFAQPNNQCISYLLKNPDIRHIACINNDTVLPDDFFCRLISFSDQHKGMIGALQTKIVSLDCPSIIDSVGITIDKSMSAINEGQGEADRGQYDRPKEIFGASASAAVYTRAALEDLLLHHGECFDGDFFAYQDDVDLAFRLRLLGFSAWYIPGRPVLHVHSATGKNYSPFKSYHIHRNTLYAIVKNFPGALMLSGFFHFIRKYASLVGSIKKKQGPSYMLSKKISVPAMMSIVLKAWLVFFLNMPLMMAKRRHIQKTKRRSMQCVKKWFVDYRADFEKITYGVR